MKFTKSFALFLFSVLCCNVFAQDNADNEPGKLRFGLKVQPNFCWLKPEEKFISNNGLRMGFGYGAMLDYRFTPNYAFSVEIMMNSINNKLRYDSLYYFSSTSNLPERYTNIDYFYNIRYVQVPLLLKMQTKEIGYFRYYGQIGVGMGILYKAKSKVQGGPQELNDYTDVRDLTNSPTYADEIRLFRPSMIIAIGTEYRIVGNTALNIGLRYDNGLLDITKENKTRVISNTISLSAGVFF